MINELNVALNDYEIEWKTLCAARRDRAFFDGLRAMAVGWKVGDLGAFDKYFAYLRAQSDQIHLGWVNERWIATFHLRDQQLAGGIELVKLMQLRPGSKDRIGLDHVDFLAPTGISAAILKATEPDLNVTDETNGAHSKWVSIWFGKTEAKLRAATVLDVCCAELKEVNDRLRGEQAKQ